MQGIRTNGRRINTIISVVLLFFIIIADQFFKCYFHQRFIDEKGDITVIKDFFFLSTTFNEGAAFSFLSDKAWAQTFFKVLTIFALVVLFVYYVLVAKKYVFLQYGVICLFAGILGNFIDRLAFGRVVDFLSFKFGSYYFPTFNIADVSITIGVIIFIIHYLFFDADAVFAKKDKI